MFAITHHNNYDHFSEVTLFDTEEEALSFMKKEWSKFYKTEKEISGIPLKEENCWYIDAGCQVAYANGDIEEWSITSEISDRRRG